MIMMAFNLKPELLTVSFSATDNVPGHQTSESASAMFKFKLSDKII